MNQPTSKKMPLHELIEELNRRKSDNIQVAAPLDHEIAKMLYLFCKSVPR